MHLVTKLNPSLVNKQAKKACEALADKTAQRSDSTKSKYYVPKCESQATQHYVQNVIYVGGVLGKTRAIVQKKHNSYKIVKTHPTCLVLKFSCTR